MMAFFTETKLQTLPNTNFSPRVRAAHKDVEEDFDELFDEEEIDEFAEEEEDYMDDELDVDFDEYDTDFDEYDDYDEDDDEF